MIVFKLGLNNAKCKSSKSCVVKQTSQFTTQLLKGVQLRHQYLLLDWLSWYNTSVIASSLPDAYVSKNPTVVK
jgi:hypothetical protein